MTEAYDECYAEGAEAYWSGLLSDDCPYEAGVRRVAWRQGYYDAADDHNEFADFEDE